jgi:hypothetical protein
MSREVMDDSLVVILPEGVIHRQQAARVPRVREAVRVPRVRGLPVRELVPVPEPVRAAAIRLVRGRIHRPVDLAQEISRLLWVWGIMRKSMILPG